MRLPGEQIKNIAQDFPQVSEEISKMSQMVLRMAKSVIRSQYELKHFSFNC